MRRLVPATLSLLIALGTAPPAAAQPQGRPWSGTSIVDDPEWRKRFLGSYGFLSGAEPQVGAGELEVLREVIEVMKVDPRAAAAMLAPQAGAQSSAALDFVLANLQFQNGDLEGARKHYQSALEKFPDFRRAHKNLGLLLVQKGEYGPALVHLSEAVELGDRDGRNYGLMGYCYINRENYLAAEEAYRNAILQQPDTRDWKLGLARSLLAMEKYPEAAALFGSLIDVDPDDSTAWLGQANAFIGLEKPMAAAVNLEAVRMLGKAQPSSLVLLGDVYMNAGMYELALGPYREVIESDRDGTRFTTAERAAELLVRTRAFDEAGQMLAAIKKRYGKQLDSDQELELLTLEARVARAQGREAEAAALLASIVSRDGTRGDALLELAAYHRSRGDTERALLMVERAEKLDEFEYPARLEHAQILVAEKDYRAAANQLRQALQIRSEPRVEQFLARVEQAVRR